MVRSTADARRWRTGRALVAPWALAALVILTSYTVTRVLASRPPDGGSSSPQRSLLDGGPAAAPAAPVAGWGGLLRTEDGLELRATLVADERLERLAAERGAGLDRRFGLAAPVWLRLLLEREGAGDEPLGVEGALLRAGEREVGVLLAEALAPTDPAGSRPPLEPLLCLLASTPRLERGVAGQLVLSCSAEPAPTGLVLETSRGRLELDLAPASFSSAELPREFRRSPRTASAGAAPGTEDADLHAELARARERIAELEERSRRRELEYLAFQREVARLELARPGEAPAAAEEGPGEAAAGSVEEQEATPAEEEQQEVLVALRALLRLEGLVGLDLLEIGAVHEARQDDQGQRRGGWVGPVIFRTLDDRGRLAGGLFAQRLRLEGSRTARTLTLVLEEGYESHGGVRSPFDGGTRRITLPLVDPEHWQRELPGLFADASLGSPLDDGRWDLGRLRDELNRLLALDIAHGWYRLHSLGGVRGDELVSVHLEEFDPDGRVRRRLFADRLRIQVGKHGVQLTLVGGASLQGDRKVPFRDGTHRIHLPGAPALEWARAELPRVEDAEETEPAEDGERGESPGNTGDPAPGAVER